MLYPLELTLLDWGLALTVFLIVAIAAFMAIVAGICLKRMCRNLFWVSVQLNWLERRYASAISEPCSNFGI